jgi:hypothetical protein
MSNDREWCKQQAKQKEKEKMLSLCAGILEIAASLVMCGVFGNLGCAVSSVDCDSEFSDSGSLKVPKLLACYTLKIATLI